MSWRAAACIAAAWAVAAPATAGTDRGTLAGRVLDATCYGPCVEGMDTPPYRGEGAIEVKRRDGSGLVRSAELDRGRFELQLPPGRYRVRVRIEDPCWSESAERVRLRDGARERVRLVVANDCIR